MYNALNHPLFQYNATVFFYLWLIAAENIRCFVEIRMQVRNSRSWIKNGLYCKKYKNNFTTQNTHKHTKPKNKQQQKKNVAFLSKYQYQLQRKQYLNQFAQAHRHTTVNVT